MEMAQNKKNNLLISVLGNRKKRRGVTTANGGSARGKGGMELQATIDRFQTLGRT